MLNVDMAMYLNFTSQLTAKETQILPTGPKATNLRSLILKLKAVNTLDLPTMPS